jgi:hypothetical protein
VLSGGNMAKVLHATDIAELLQNSIEMYAREGNRRHDYKQIIQIIMDCNAQEYYWEIEKVIRDRFQYKVKYATGEVGWIQPEDNSRIRNLTYQYRNEPKRSKVTPFQSVCGCVNKKRMRNRGRVVDKDGQAWKRRYCRVCKTNIYYYLDGDHYVSAPYIRRR